MKRERIKHDPVKQTLSVYVEIATVDDMKRLVRAGHFVNLSHFAEDALAAYLTMCRPLLDQTDESEAAA